MSELVVVERDGPVQVIRLNRPEKKNAITRDMYAVLARALRDGDGDRSVRCHVLFGTPGAFSAGNDLADFLSVSTGGESGPEVLDFLLSLANAEKPIVSGVDGVAIGIGATLNLHCDLTFATARTVFKTPFVDLGLVPEAGSSQLLPAILGRQRAFAMLALGEDLSAGQALAAGLIYAVVGEDRLEATALEAARRVAAKPPEALRIARDLMRGPRAGLVARIEEEIGHFEGRLRSEEARAAFTAFMTRKRT